MMGVIGSCLLAYCRHEGTTGREISHSSDDKEGGGTGGCVVEREPGTVSGESFIMPAKRWECPNLQQGGKASGSGILGAPVLMTLEHILRRCTHYAAHRPALQRRIPDLMDPF